MKMKWLVGSAVAAFAALGASAAFAADLPTRKEAPVPYVAPFTWTGFYIGGNVGWVGGAGSLDVTGTPEYQALAPYGLVPTSFSGHSNNALIGGGQIGYNYQFGQWVLGVETDFDGTTLDRSGSFTGGYLDTELCPVNNPHCLPHSTLTTTGSANLDWLGTARARLGFAPLDKLLLYATGGLAYGGGSGSGGVIANAAPSVIYWSGSTNSSARVGWTVGGGAEFAVTNNVTFKAEYLYYNLGSEDVSAYGSTGAVNLVGPNLYLQTKANIDGSIARVGVNYKF